MADGLELSDTTATPGAVGTRRRLLTSLVTGGGVAASGAWVPESWTRPVIESVLLPAHAQTTADNVCMNTSTGNAEFAFTGEPQDFEVPAGVCSLTVTLNGAGGAGAHFTNQIDGGSDGGAGERVADTIAVTPLEALTIIVGGGGTNGPGLDSPGGFGGGSGGDGEAGAGLGGGGGGASSVRRGGVILLEAGGGGGGGLGGAFGGNGGGANGGAGSPGFPFPGGDAGNGNGAAGSAVNLDSIGGSNGSAALNW